jgi:asparagine synthase (glutamine-hydrolysing)
MCGICGVYSKDGIDRNDVKKMVKILEHRGPDGNGIYSSSNVCLGHTRLAILDLSDKGKQPMFSDDGEAVIVYNGEVYNYIELRKELEDLRYKFHSGTDTEVILKAYLAWGKQCVEKFNGMWAFAIWDERTKELWLARDQFGIKPLYYTEVEGRTYFASEIKALLPFRKAVPDKKRCYQFFMGRVGENEKETMFDGIYKTPFSYIPTKLPNYPHLFKPTFLSSVHIRLRADVPIGTCLSGGLDSSSIVCTLLQNENIERMKAISACYDDNEHDEREYIEAIKSDKLENHYVFPDTEGLLKDIDDLVYYQDEPFDGGGIYSQWRVFREAKKRGVTVLLDGQGSDEILAGYTYYQRFNRLATMKPYPKDRLGVKVFEHPRFYTLYQMYRFPHMQKYYDACPYPKQFKTALTNRLYFDVITSLPRILKWEDRNSMAFGLETRLPFLDQRLVDIIFSLDDSMKINNGWTKCVLRKSMKGILPEKIRLRKDKKGFTSPDELWLTELKDEVTTTLETPFAEEVSFKKGATQKYLNKFYNAHEKDSAKMVWKLYCFQKWKEVFYDK